jgi:hypothetical protein
MRLRYARREKLRELGHRLRLDRIQRQRETDSKIAKTFERVDRIFSSIPESMSRSRFPV